MPSCDPHPGRIAHSGVCSFPAIHHDTHHLPFTSVCRAPKVEFHVHFAHHTRLFIFHPFTPVKASHYHPRSAGLPFLLRRATLSAQEGCQHKISSIDMRAQKSKCGLNFQFESWLDRYGAPRGEVLCPDPEWSGSPHISLHTHRNPISSPALAHPGKRYIYIHNWRNDEKRGDKIVRGGDFPVN